MAATPTRPSAEASGADAPGDAAALPAAGAVAVAASGGRDSTALLHCTARAARALGLQVHALHVHHGLQPDADAWVHQLAAQCRRWARGGLPLTLHVQHLAGAPAAGDSVEAWARRERYAALAAMARAAGCDTVLLAQHRRDQAETVLLQLLRGAGARGLAAMPVAAMRDGIHWLRPWREQPREAIEAYLARHRLRWVDDASNAGERHVRSRLRVAVWPALRAAFPQAETALCHAAARAAEEAACLEALARLDAVQVAPGGEALHVPSWRALSAERRANVLRRLLDDWLGRGAPQTLVQRLLAELPRTAHGRWPAPGGELRLYRGLLRHAAAEPPAPAGRDAASRSQPSHSGPRTVTRAGLEDDARAGAGTDASARLGDDPSAQTNGAADAVIDLSRPGCWRASGWAGRWVVREVRDGGIATVRLESARIVARRGGERFQSHPAGVPRSLKKQFQAAGLQPWARDAPLLLDADGALLLVPGLGVDARAIASAGVPQRALRWVPDPGR